MPIEIPQILPKEITDKYDTVNDHFISIENLEISSYCNLNCDYCGRKFMKRKKMFMSLGDVNMVGRLIEGRQKEIWL